MKPLPPSLILARLPAGQYAAADDTGISPFHAGYLATANSIVARNPHTKGTPPHYLWEVGRTELLIDRKYPVRQAR